MSSQVEVLGIVDQSTEQPPLGQTQRLISLDVFRGFTLLGMVLVNSHPGAIYPALGHASWNGWGFADLIFPFFVFIVGVAIPPCIRQAHGARRKPRKAVLAHSAPLHAVVCDWRFPERLSAV